ncbi:MAG TPA: hypothetical protein VFW07_26200 [Parafilimonas sp.]|nr:hypothetical protein [Parafilimonas sp.]
MRQNLIIKNRGVVLALALCGLIIPVILIELNVLRSTNGVFIYPLDDTYIHMSIAKNLALYHNWGISANEFQSASSSIVYTILLSASFTLFGVNTIIPFIINLIAGIVLLIVIQQRLKKENIGLEFQLIILLLVIFFTPLPVIIISGMEHTLQCLFSFLFIFNFSDWIGAAENNALKRKKLPVSLFIYGAIICGLRYEGLFIMAIACCILLYYKRILTAFALGFISILPLIIFGIFSVMKGSYFLPNSVLLKSSPVQLSGNGFVNFISNILIDKLTIAKTGITALATQRLLLILPLGFFFFRSQIKNMIAYKLIIIVLTICTLLQLSFAATGWFYRYEAYLVLCSTVILSILTVKGLKEWHLTRNKMSLAVSLLVAFFLFFPLILRSTAAYAKASQACINIYEQQYQMGNFVKKYYDMNAVAVNDIGAVSYLNQAKILDLWGLANIQVAKAKKNNSSTPEFLSIVANNEHIDFAIVYDSWFDPALLSKWQKVATWQIENNVICGDATVSFYAVKPDMASSLRTNLKAYQQSLPGDIKVEYF